MKNIIISFLCILPSTILCQGITYEEGLNNCKKILEEKQKLNPDTYIISGPDCIIGARVPDFSAITLDGKEISADYFKGKITVLNFWLISCPPCLAELPGFNKVIEKFGHERLNYLAISLDDKEDIEHHLKNNPWGFSQIASGIEITLDVFQARWGFPTTFVINEDAVIIAAFSGGKTDETAPKELEDKLTDIINTVLK